MADTFRPLYQRHHRLLGLGLGVLATGIAWWFRFVQDDAYITFRYARNLAQGNGLVFNPGEPVEGYTNFLWTLLMAVPERFGWSTPLFSVLVGIPTFLIVLSLAYRLACRILRDEVVAFFAVVLLVGNFTFVSYATSGLETMLQTALVNACLLCLLTDRAPGTRRRLAAGAFAGLAVLTRMDSGVLIGSIVAIHLALSAGRVPLDRRVRELGRAAAAMSVPFIAVVGPWLVWKQAYYGDLVPNTFRAKSGAGLIGPIAFGLLFLLVFVLGYGYVVLAPRLVRYRRILFRLPLSQFFLVLPIWCLYVVFVGADFMEFRFMVPVMPLLAVMGAFLIDVYTSVVRQVLIAGTLAVMAVVHAAVPSLGYPVFTVHDLRLWPDDGPSTPTVVGARLGHVLNHPGDPVVLGLGAVGAIPYESGLRTVDLIGLTDAKVARDGEPFGTYFPGHLRIAPIDYLESRDVALVAVALHQRPVDPDRRSYRLSELMTVYPVVDLKELPASAQVVEFQTTEGLVWPLIYLREHSAVDRAIRSGELESYPIEFACDPADVSAGERFLLERFGTRTCPL